MAESRQTVTLDDLDQTLNAIVEALRSMGRIQGMQTEMLSRVLIALKPTPTAGESELEKLLRGILDASTVHAEQLTQVVTLLQDRRAA